LKVGQLHISLAGGIARQLLVNGDFTHLHGPSTAYTHVFAFIAAFVSS